MVAPSFPSNRQDSAAPQTISGRRSSLVTVAAVVAITPVGVNRPEAREHASQPFVYATGTRPSRPRRAPGPGVDWSQQRVLRFQRLHAGPQQRELGLRRIRARKSLLRRAGP